MELSLAPLRAESLKNLFVTRFEELILSGGLKIGQKLPSERELALQLGVSRPVVHEGLLELAGRGLVAIRPRVGTVVSDFRAEGSLALLNSLVRYQGGLDPAILSSMLDMRELFEVETTRRAAANRTDDQAQGLLAHVDREDQTDPEDVDRITRIDFEFHHRVALASNNVMYPMLIQSFREVYLHLAGLFFRDLAMAARVFGRHRLLALAIGRKDEDQAGKEMKELLDHGRDRLIAALGKEKNR